MQLQIEPNFLSAAASAVLAGSGSIFFWHRRNLTGAGPFVFVAIGVALWCAADAAEAAASGLPAKLFWVDFHYISLVTVPLAWLLTVLQFSGLGHLATRRRILALCVVPAITLALVLTSGMHGLMRYDVHLDTSGLNPIVAKHYGPWFWVHATYSYLLLLSSAALLVHSAARGATHTRRIQAAALLFAMAIPWAIDVSFLVHPELLAVFDPSPVVVAASGLIVAWAIARHRLFDIEPQARDKLFEWMSDGVILIDRDGSVRNMNPAAQRIFGISSTSGVRGAPCRTLFASVPSLAALCGSDEDGHGEVVVEGPEPRYYEVFVSSLTGAAGERSGRVVTIHDTTERKLAERSLSISEERYRTLAEAAQDIIFIVDAGGTILFANSFAARQRGCSPTELTGKPLTFLLLLDSPEAHDAVIQRVASTGKQAHLEHRARLADRDVWLHTSLVALRGEGDSAASVLGISRDVTELVLMREDLRTLSLIDDLTGVCNRRGFVTLARQQLKLAQRNDQLATILVADLDGLKEINDTYGHTEGDRALAETAEIIRSSCRDSDVVARWGGDEFSVLAIEAAATGAESLAQRILDAVVERNSAGPRLYDLSLSIGVVRDRATAFSSIEEFLSNADRLMYEDKKAKRARSLSLSSG
ncbi:MAG TPA: histidine kinase N-terminal 7TM domain-containing protein [Chloroflexota bacterium]